MAMIYQVRNSLSSMDCAAALKVSTELFESKYVDNDIRMLHACSYACAVGIQLYPVIDEISSADLSSFNAMIKTFVRIFPSRTALDSKLQSAWYAQDILHSVLNPGSVMAPADQVELNEYSTASLLYRDRTDDSNSFLIFNSMAGIGTSLNRYGYNPSDDPAALSYAQVLPLTWITGTLIKSDTSHAGCSLASSMLNMFDGISAVSSITSGPLSSAFVLISTFQTAIQTAANNKCAADGFSSAECALATQRLRFRDACFEQDAAASAAAGIVEAINIGW